MTLSAPAFTTGAGAGALAVFREPMTDPVGTPDAKQERKPGSFPMRFPMDFERDAPIEDEVAEQPPIPPTNDNDPAVHAGPRSQLEGRFASCPTIPPESSLD
jgi:hypothetical protein